jgi:hypothetical protein
MIDRSKLIQRGRFGIASGSAVTDLVLIRPDRRRTRRPAGATAAAGRRGAVADDRLLRPPR